MHNFFLNIGRWSVQIQSCCPCSTTLLTVPGIYPDPDLSIEIVYPDSPKTSVSNFFKDNGLTKGMLLRDSHGIRRIVLWSDIEGWYDDPTNFELSMLRAFYTLAQDSLYRSIIIHSCAILRDGFAYMFLGPSGSGKTTVASLSLNQGILLHDELIILDDESHGLSVQGTPFHTTMPVEIHRSAPLRAAFFLKHGGSLNFQPMKHTDVFMQMMKQIVPPESFDLSGFLMDYNQINTIMDINTRLANTIPFYAMEFSPDSDFWKGIESLA